jgi:guanylate kinase
MGTGNLIVIVAPSGAGKSSLLKKIFEQFQSLRWSVSYTTRGARSGEVNGRDYHFIDVEEFERLIEKDSFVEWAKVHHNYYGTSKKAIKQALENSENIVLDIDVQGADNIKIDFPDSKIIFIEPPSIEELKRRLLGRATDDLEVINNRLKNAEEELKKKDDYDFKVVNDDFERALSELSAIVKGILK